MVFSPRAKAIIGTGATMAGGAAVNQFPYIAYSAMALGLGIAGWGGIQGVREWHTTQRKAGFPGVQAWHFLAIGAVGVWLFMTMTLGAAGWMLWNGGGAGIAAAAKPQDEGPIAWNYSFGIDRRGPNVVAIHFLGSNVAKNEVQIKEANITSAIDGSKIPLTIVATNDAGKSEYVALDRVQLIPPGARIELIASFAEPGIESKSFLERWRQFSFNAKDDSKSYRLVFNDTHWMPFFQGIVGPRVTVKPEVTP